MSNHTHNPASPIRCKRCKTELARSFGAGVVVGAVRIVGKVELICDVCEWGNLFYPAPASQKNVAFQAQTAVS